MAIVSVRNIKKTYNKGKVVALRDLSFDVEEGEIYGIIGPDGAGKTSLFRILTTLLLADSGTASVDGLDVLANYKEIRKRIGYMPGKFSLYQDLSIEENLEFFATIFGTTIEENYNLVKDIYQQIEKFKTRKAGKLSGGMKQKLALSCALIHAPTSIPGSTAPLIFVGTTITHLFGGSAGREGAALQLGGVLGYQLGRALKLDEKDIHLIVMCGMSSVFSALFGSPLTAAVFAMEVASVGILHFSAILPCLTASLTAAYLASALGAAAETFPLGAAVPFTWASAGTVVAIAAACALLSIVYCIALRQGGKALGKAVPNSYLRVFLGGSAVVLLSVLLGTRDYNGAGMDVIAAAMQGHARPEAFALKMLFTVLTMTTGYKGGEIVPAMFIGATAGCVLGDLFGLAPGLGAAVGLLGMFCGSLNCPISAIFLGVEMFGGANIQYYAIAAAISFMLSANFGLYKEQKIVYSKIRAEFINRYTD